jgi:hypothetical protein
MDMNSSREIRRGVVELNHPITSCIRVVIARTTSRAVIAKALTRLDSCVQQIKVSS